MVLLFRFHLLLNHLVVLFHFHLLLNHLALLFHFHLDLRFHLLSYHLLDLCHLYFLSCLYHLLQVYLYLCLDLDFVLEEVVVVQLVQGVLDMYPLSLLLMHFLLPK